MGSSQSLLRIKWPDGHILVLSICHVCALLETNWGPPHGHRPALRVDFHRQAAVSATCHFLRRRDPSTVLLTPKTVAIATRGIPSVIKSGGGRSRTSEQWKPCTSLVVISEDVVSRLSIRKPLDKSATSDIPGGGQLLTLWSTGDNKIHIFC